ncbi:MAG TPA: cytochrome b/b6 domain-containing protein [Candidatus Duodenibacillus intestinigallinarum]|nr:cytochrome b/b6 domain-containing protein [Candidatus Duodenibacillus intestinigallinarum]
MRSVLIRRFEISDQLTHLFNALFWVVLAATCILIGTASRANVEPTHLSIGVHFAFGFALAVLLSAYILFAKSRFQRMLFEIFRTDRPFLAWLKCLGGYPSKILNRPQKSSSVPPQGRYNTGQRIAYGALIFLNILLLASGFAFSHCTNRRRYRAVLTDWRYASIPALSVLPVCCLLHIFRWRFCRDRAQSHVVVSGKSFFGKTRSMSPLG